MDEYMRKRVTESMLVLFKNKHRFIRKRVTFTYRRKFGCIILELVSRAYPHYGAQQLRTLAEITEAAHPNTLIEALQQAAEELESYTLNCVLGEQHK